MRRLLAFAAALALAVGPLAAGGQALAKDHGGGRGEQRGGGEGRWGGDRGGGRGGPQGGWRGGEGPAGGRWGGEGPGRWERREAPRYEPRYEPRPDPRGDPRYDPRYDRGERAYPAPPPAYGPPRRGGYIGPQGGAPVEDPGRYRLREAPRGYQWMRVPGGMALINQATGQVFDVVPDR